LSTTIPKRHFSSSSRIFTKDDIFANTKIMWLFSSNFRKFLRCIIIATYLLLFS
jgi:hypothetical protein